MKPTKANVIAIARDLKEYVRRSRGAAQPHLIHQVNRRLRGGQTVRSSDAEWKTLTLGAVEFLRRFVLHVLPPGFVRIRYFGFLSNRHRREAVARCCEQLGGDSVDWAVEEEKTGSLPKAPGCPVCEEGPLLELRALPRYPRPPSRAPP